jgi:hypothetical protein
MTATASPSPPAGTPPAAQHWHRAVPAVERMLEYAPASGSLALWVQHRDLPAEDLAGRSAGDAGGPAASRAGQGLTAARAAVTTDGTHLFYAPAFAELPLAQQAGCVAHGVLHIALRHVPRLHALRATLGDVDTQLFNLCADAIVNSALSHLTWLTLPTGAVTLERVLDEVLGVAAGAPDTALAQWDVERLYRAVDDRRAPGDGRAAARGARGGEGMAIKTGRAAAGANRRTPTANARPSRAVMVRARCGCACSAWRPRLISCPTAPPGAPPPRRRKQKPNSRATGTSACCAHTPAMVRCRCCVPCRPICRAPARRGRWCCAGFWRAD